MINAGFHVRVDSARVSLGFSKAVSWYCWTIARLIAPPPSKQIVLSYHFTQQAYANNIIFASKASFQDMRLIFQGNLFYGHGKLSVVLPGCHFSSSPCISLLHLARTLMVLDRMLGNMRTLFYHVLQCMFFTYFWNTFKTQLQWQHVMGTGVTFAPNPGSHSPLTQKGSLSILSICCSTF